ncbi:DUF262 domain-containing protein [uncultured Methanobacterium sp.]|uniref:DUF262 domain-containing protein n=1 Tax=uncultured Methanobacterium sp. TaxID=176306 RepID=UPI002AA66AB4|nr:DUF262 domain-containing protein [uncultured Methanobacterium sp.]
MKANDTKIETFLQGSKQFVVPLFQRTYSWEKEDIKKLWTDLKATRDDPEYIHFFGSFVTMPIPTGPGIPDEYIVIDGQQRLTTIFTLLIALRNQIISLDPDYPNKDEIDEMYLINKFQPQFKYKLAPTQADRTIFNTLIDDLNPFIDNSHMLFDVYSYFKSEFSLLGNIDKLIEYKDALLSRFMVVDIYLESGDDPYLIFESLNGTGKPLTQSDLIRNYLFMKFDQNDQESQEKYYRKLWYPMQQELQDNLEYFIRHFLSINGVLPTFNKIYSVFKEKYDVEAKNQDDIIKLMEDLHRYAGYYSKFLNPKNESNENIRSYFEKFKRLEVTTPYPLLLALYNDYAKEPGEKGKIDTEVFLDCLKSIETYVLRRAVCKIPVNALNQYLPTIYSSLDPENVSKSLKDMFKNAKGSRRMPDSEEFKKCFKDGVMPKKTIRYVLEEIEKYPDNKELVDPSTLQIEHIMPQTLTNDWKNDLGENWELLHKKYLETIGNLTLTGYNPEYSNRTFKEKNTMENGFKESGLRLNAYLSTFDTWNKEGITKRANYLLRIALELWNMD